MAIPNLPENHGWTDVEYLGDRSDSLRVGAILNEACHVFRYHADGTWNSHGKDLYARRLVPELQRRPGLVGRLLSTDDRVVKMITYRALELLKESPNTNL
jgi:hypothetical protein